MTRKNKILASILAIVLFSIAVLFYLEASSKGFPDGHLTELDRAEKPLCYISSVTAILIGLFFLYLARFSRSVNTHRMFRRTLLFLFVLILIISGLDWYFVETLDDGIGR